MERYFLHCTEIIEIFSTIRLEYQERLTTAIGGKF